jgi:hypothetical protein
MEPYLARDFSKSLFTKQMFRIFRGTNPNSIPTINVPSSDGQQAIRARKNAESQFYSFCELIQPGETMDCLFIMNERERLFQAVESARLLEKTVFGLK